MNDSPQMNSKEIVNKLVEKDISFVYHENGLINMLSGVETFYGMFPDYTINDMDENSTFKYRLTANIEGGKVTVFTNTLPPLTEAQHKFANALKDFMQGMDYENLCDAINDFVKAVEDGHKECENRVGSDTERNG